MDTLFGIPMSTLVVVLPVALGVLLAVTLVLALRQPVLLRMSWRNAARRKGRAALIILGLMLGTAIITAALSTGDTMTYAKLIERIIGLGLQWQPSRMA